MPGESMADFVASLERPRAVIVMVKAGAPTDAVIDELMPLLEAGDIIVDCGNAHFADTRRREEALREHGLHFVGTGVSGGEEGALLGPSIMPGGSAESYRKLGPIFEKIAAQVDGVPCCTHVGPDGAGHFVKMVHNGIEYADMQLIAEAYDLLRAGPGRDAGGDRGDLPRAGTTASWSRSSSRSPPTCWRTPTRRPAGRSWTSCTTRPSRRAPAGGPCRARSTWASRSPASPRRRSPGRCPGTPTSGRRRGGRSPRRRREVAGRPTGTTFIEDVRRALLASKIVAYAQGFDHIRAGSRGVRLGHRPAAARPPSGGAAASSGPASWTGSARRTTTQPEPADACWSRRTSPRPSPTACRAGGGSWPTRPGPACRRRRSRRRWRTSTRCAAERLPAALIQGLRDNFGAHTYQRVDREGSFHTTWAGDRTESPA